jgi:hypothetical protein
VTDRYDFDPVVRLAEDNEKREPPEKISTRPGKMERPLSRGLLNLRDGVIDLGHE